MAADRPDTADWRTGAAGAVRAGRHPGREPFRSGSDAGTGRDARYGLVVGSVTAPPGAVL